MVSTLYGAKTKITKTACSSGSKAITIGLESNTSSIGLESSSIGMESNATLESNATSIGMESNVTTIAPVEAVTEYVDDSVLLCGVPWSATTVEIDGNMETILYNQLMGDNHCDDYLNFIEYDWDGGDCCQGIGNFHKMTQFCTECRCKVRYNG